MTRKGRSFCLTQKDLEYLRAFVRLDRPWRFQANDDVWRAVRRLKKLGYMRETTAGDGFEPTPAGLKAAKCKFAPAPEEYHREEECEDRSR